MAAERARIFVDFIGASTRSWSLAGVKARARCALSGPGRASEDLLGAALIEALRSAPDATFVGRPATLLWAANRWAVGETP
jgi:hypothetical protein